MERVSALTGVGLLRSVLVLVIGVGAVSLSAAAGCSASGNGNETGFANGGGSGSGSGSNSGGFSAVGSGANPGAGGAINTDSGTGPGLLEDGQACASESHRAEQSPLDLYIMLDKSGSMVVEDFGTKWPAVVNAIKGFINQSPQTDGLGVGLAIFPADDPQLTSCIQTCGGTCACVQQCGCTSGCNC